MSGPRSHSETDFLTDYAVEDTLDLIDQRLETATLPVSNETAYALFASFLEQRRPKLDGSVHSHDQDDSHWVAWTSSSQPVSGRACFLPLGDRACLMQCELSGKPEENEPFDLEAAARIVSDFREYVAVVTLLS